ncbi:sigma-70 family RNA polymerase sigma factor [Actinokineospora inagensis]|uniref:sigma-70 family RNA polymerase sigma factor n=1 Tax=Actinokineospora inagensis TaxID=103730 RepID=UPI0004047F5A|nr:sigma-70 family RNA polymerase sigma factor [Actinokineospora inagensis]
MSTVPAEAEGPSDAELIAAVRAGNTAAYGSLYERHAGAARNLARQLARSAAEADDLVSEAFAKVLETLRQGRGPDAAFRAYLLTALRHTAYDKTRRDRRLELSDDLTQVSGISQDAVSVPFADTAVAGLERSLAARAFQRLPERWRAVLWHTEIEGQSPAEVAPLLGLTPNGVSALAYRAREGLKQAYLQVHLAESADQRCRATADRLGAWVRGGLSKREKAQVEAHLDECDRCRALAAELADVNSGLRLFIAPLVLGPLAVAGYLAAAKSTSAAAVAGSAAAAGTTAVGTTAAAGSSGSSGALGAISSVPRQVVTAAVSGAALVAAVVVGLVAAPNHAQVPTAATSQVPTSTTRAPRTTAPPQVPPATTEPTTTEPTTTTPEPTTTTPAPTTTAEPTEPTTTTPVPTTTTSEPTATTAPEPTTTTTPPPPGTPRLSASGPSGPVSLKPGTPTEVPITVSNAGTAVSEPVVAVLPLPTGVRAEPGPASLAGPRMLRLDLLSTTIDCPGGTGRVVCGTNRGLAPGETITLVYRLVAEDTQITAQIAGTLTAGTEVSLDFVIGIEVTPLPDGVDISGAVVEEPGVDHSRETRVVATATNTGESSKAVAVTFDRRVRFIAATREVVCTTGADFVNCVSTAPLPPTEKIDISVGIARKGGGTEEERGGRRKLVIRAALGDATDSTTVTVPWWPGDDHHPQTTSTEPEPTTEPGSTPPPAGTTPPTTTTGPTATTTPVKPPTTTTKPPTTAPNPTTTTTTTRPTVVQQPKPLISLVLCVQIGRSDPMWRLLGC